MEQGADEVSGMAVDTTGVAGGVLVGSGTYCERAAAGAELLVGVTLRLVLLSSWSWLLLCRLLLVWAGLRWLKELGS